MDKKTKLSWRLNWQTRFYLEFNEVDIKHLTKMVTYIDSLLYDFSEQLKNNVPYRYEEGLQKITKGDLDTYFEEAKKKL